MESELSDLVRATLQTRIIEAFRGTPEAIDELVKSALSKDVNSYGNEPKYGNDKMPYLTYLAGETIRDVARQAVHEWIQESEPRIKEMVKSRLADADIVGAFVGEITNIAKNRTWKVDIKFGGERD